MVDERSLGRGLLGHWPGDRSPGGIVRDRSPEENHGNYGVDARWIWFTNPRAFRRVGDRDRTYVCYLGGPTGTDIVAAAYDHDDGSFATTVVEESFSVDDHTNPSVHVRDDGHVLLFWAGHNGEALYYTISEEPESVASFGERRTVEQESVTYPNPIDSPGGSDELFLFYRDRVYTRDTTDNRFGYMGDGNVYYRVSDDGGETWSEQTQIATPPDGHYSLYFVPARGEDAIHFFFTDAERGGDAPKWNIMYAQLRDGSFHAADGRLLAEPSDLPMEKGDLDLVYDSHSDENHHTWVWDAAVDDHGFPVVAYATFPSTLSHEYRYARWDGERWRDYHLADAGRYIARRPIELHYSGGLAIDRDDPSVVYGCVSGDDHSALKRFETPTGGRTWAEMTVTRRPLGWDIRPVVPRNASDELPVVWLTGSYEHMDTSQTVLRGLPADHLSGDVLEGDGRHGVDLGLDLYDATTFAGGATVVARIQPGDVTDPGVVANFGGGLTLGTALNGEPGVSFVATGRGGETELSWTGAETGDECHVAGVWDGSNRLSLAIDGAVIDGTEFRGPIAFDGDRSSWTLLKDEYLIGRGFDGSVADVRLYDRPLQPDEIDALASRDF